MISLPFLLEGETVTASELFGDTLPPRTTIFFWDKTNQIWIGDTFTQGFFGNPNFWNPGTTQYARGDGIFIRIPDDADEEQYSIVISGEVPSSQSGNILNRNLEAGKLYLVGTGFPVALSISDPEFGLNPSPGDTIFVWNNSEGGYVGSTFTQGFFGNPNFWSNPDLVITPGEGFIYRSLSQQIWSIDKNDLYVWP